jgi:hypothetical protein
MYVICMRMCWGVASARLGTIDARNIPITPTNCCACALIDLACLKSSGARRTLPPPTTLLQSHPYAIRACNHHRITFLRKTPRGAGPQNPNHVRAQHCYAPTRPDVSPLGSSPVQSQFTGHNSPVTTYRLPSAFQPRLIGLRCYTSLSQLALR